MEASKAFPPFFNISIPTALAIGCAEDTAPCLPTALFSMEYW